MLKMNNIRRRITTALFLMLLIFSVMPVFAQAAGLQNIQEQKMDAMGNEAMIWFRAFRSAAIPLLIVRYASNGLKLIGNTAMSKGEYRLDSIKFDIFYSTLATIMLFLIPAIMQWARDLFEAGAWVPPSPDYS